MEFTSETCIGLHCRTSLSTFDFDFKDLCVVWAVGKTIIVEVEPNWLGVLQSGKIGNVWAFQTPSADNAHMCTHTSTLILAGW